MNSQPPPPAAILGIIAGYWLSRAVYLAAKLKLADRVGERVSLAELAAATGTQPAALRRLMRALTAHGIFREEADSFTQTPVSEALRTDHPASMRAVAEVELGHDHYDSWRNIEDCLRGDGIAFDRLYGKPVWQYYAEHPELEALFGEAMTSITALANAGVLGAYSFEPFKRAVDVGGGHGSFLSAILELHPKAVGILYDLPTVAEKAAAGDYVRRHDGRLRAVGGDFFKEVPVGDLYLLRFILHDWDDARSVQILSNIRKEIAPNGRLVVIEMVLPGPNEPHVGPLMDLNMMVMTGGLERTEADFAALFDKAGFRLQRRVATASPFSVLEAAPA
jgi:hypothetical protein